ncbi:MAG: phosphotransferase [Pirellulaceae bacterium]|nr:phosphotransferase [Pirellulaceae bacterium]
MLELTPASAAGYLRDRGAIGPVERVEIRELSGGVSNTVLLVHRPELPGGDFVLKQALPRLKVQQDWLCSIERIWREVETLELCNSLLASGGRQPPVTNLSTSWAVRVPQVLFADRSNYCYAMTAAPAGHQTWKDQLIAGQTEPTIASACGTLLGTLHAGSWRNTHISARLDDRTFFDSLRLDPYYRCLAVVYPDLAGALNKLIDDTYATRLCLVHGDFSPKNLLISPGQIWLIDFEVGHFGDPAFDLGFFFTHLALKAIRAGERRDDYLALVDPFWNAYKAVMVQAVGPEELTNLSRRSARHWAACMLARVDGKSPVDYLATTSQQFVRNLAVDFLRTPPESVSDFLKGLDARVKGISEDYPPLPASGTSA